MELEQMSCCGMFELCNIGDANYDGDGEVWNPKTEEYEDRGRVSARQAIAACKKDIKAELDEIDPRGRVVIATTVPGMGTAVAALRSLRFRVAKRFYNGNSGNRVTVWMKLVR